MSECEICDSYRNWMKVSEEMYVLIFSGPGRTVIVPRDHIARSVPTDGIIIKSPGLKVAPMGEDGSNAPLTEVEWDVIRNKYYSKKSCKVVYNGEHSHLEVIAEGKS